MMKLMMKFVAWLAVVGTLVVAVFMLGFHVGKADEQRWPSHEITEESCYTTGVAMSIYRDLFYVRQLARNPNSHWAPIFLQWMRDCDDVRQELERQKTGRIERYYYEEQK